jgi:hypothetical protein
MRFNPGDALDTLYSVYCSRMAAKAFQSIYFLLKMCRETPEFVTPIWAELRSAQRADKNSVCSGSKNNVKVVQPCNIPQHWKLFCSGLSRVYNGDLQNCLCVSL